MQANQQSSSLKGGTALCDPKFQQDLSELRKKLTEANERCSRGHISINEMLYEVEVYVNTIREQITMKRTFSYQEYSEDVLDKYFQVLIENFPSPNPVLSRLCFEGLVRGHIINRDYLPKVVCRPPLDMASFFFKTAHILQQLHASQHSFFSEFTHTQVRTPAILQRRSHPARMIAPSGIAVCRLLSRCVRAEGIPHVQIPALCSLCDELQLSEGGFVARRGYRSTRPLIAPNLQLALPANGRIQPVQPPAAAPRPTPARPAQDVLRGDYAHGHVQG